MRQLMITCTMAAFPFILTAQGNRIQLVPDTVVAGAGEEIQQDIVVITEPGSAVDAVGLYLDFDPEIIEINSVEQGENLEITLELSWDNASGQFNYAGGTLSSSVPDSFRLATITWTSGEDGGMTAITYDSIFPRKTEIASAGISLDTDLIPAKVSVEISTSLEEPMDAGVALYPNPTSGKVHFPSTANTTSTCRIIGSDGSIYETTLSDNTLDLGFLPAGLYTIQSTHWTQKVLKY